MLSAASHIPFSIVIPSHRRADLLRICLTSVTRHAPAGTEIIVVDDGSDDARISETALGFNGVRVLRHVRRKGFCSAANRGVEASRGEVVELLNDDTQVAPDWALSALRCFDDARIGAVAPLVLKGNPDSRCVTIDSAGDEYDIGGFAWKRGHGEHLSSRHLQPRLVSCASGSSVFLRRSAVLETGLFPEHFGAYFEDVDLSLRLRKAGYLIKYEPSSRVWHQCSGSHGKPRRRLTEQQSRNEEWLFWRNLDRAHRGRAVFRHLAVLLGKSIRRVREGKLMPFLMGRLRSIHEAL